MVLVARDVRGPWPDHVQRDTTSDGMLAFGHSRSGFTQALVAQQAEQPPCKRQAARSNRRRGHHQSSRVRLDGRGHHSLASPLLRRTRWIRGFARRTAPDARQRRLQAEGAARAIPHATPAQGTLVELSFGVEIGRNDWAAPAHSAGLSSRKPRVRLPHEAPDQFAEIAQQVERCIEGVRVGGLIPSLGTRKSEPR
jgi:hypothetical protein